MKTKKATKRKPKRYRVLTWDLDLQKWTPQIGIPRRTFTRAELVKTILPKLNDMGYQCDESEIDEPDGSGSPCLSIEEA